MRVAWVLSRSRISLDGCTGGGRGTQAPALDWQPPAAPPIELTAGEQWREPLHPAVDRDVIHLDTALGQQFLHVAVGQAVAQIPKHRQHDDLTGKPEPSTA